MFVNKQILTMFLLLILKEIWLKTVQSWNARKNQIVAPETSWLLTADLFILKSNMMLKEYPVLMVC